MARVYGGLVTIWKALKDKCGRGLAPVQTGDIVYISNRGHGLQANTHDQEVTDHALEPRVPHESKNQAGS